MYEKGYTDFLAWHQRRNSQGRPAQLIIDVSLQPRMAHKKLFCAYNSKSETEALRCKILKKKKKKSNELLIVSTICLHNQCWTLNSENTVVVYSLRKHCPKLGRLYGT